MRRLLPIVLLSMSCSTLVPVMPKEIITVKCFADECPTQDQVLETVSMVWARVPGFTLPEGITVNWYPKDHIFWPADETGGNVIGFTFSKSEVYVTSHPVLVHELMHVFHWIANGNADSNHSEPGGPWHENTDLAILSVEMALAN